MMKTRHILIGALIASGAFFLLSVLIFLLQPSEILIRTVSDVFPLILSVISAALSVVILWFNRRKPSGRLIWGAMTLGLVLWMIGELLWTVYDFADLGEIPYPSLADVSWLVGYIPLFVALFAQFLALRAGLSRTRRILLVFITLLMVPLIYLLVVQPMLFSPDAGTPVEMFFNAAYPVGDTVLLAVGFALLLIFFGGELAMPWGVLAIGILLLSIADLLFSYGTWNSLYYPEGEFTAFSAVFDLMYVASNIVWALGLLLFLLLRETGRGIDLRSLVLAEEQTEEGGQEADAYLMMTNLRGQSAYLDPSLVRLLGLDSAQQGMGLWFGELLGMGESESNAAIQELPTGAVRRLPDVVLGQKAQPYRVWISASGTGDGPTGFDLLLKPAAGSAPETPRREEFLLDRFLYQRTIRQETQSRAGITDHNLRVYFDTLVIALGILLNRTGGTAVQEAFEGMLNVEGIRHDCGFEIRQSRITWRKPHVPPVCYRGLLDAAVQYAQDIAAPTAVTQLLAEMEKNLDPQVVLTAVEHNLRIARS
jgi:hypothetical protein